MKLHPTARPAAFLASKPDVAAAVQKAFSGGTLDAFERETLRAYLEDNLEATVDAILHSRRLARRPLRGMPLSPREREVLLLCAQGRSQAEIALLTHRAFSTTKTHIDTARRKLGARNTVHAVVLALASGQLDIEALKEAG